MAWIESHQALKDHPKTIGTAVAMGWDIDMTLGKLHRFWWWCLDFAPNGDLRKINDAQLATVMCVDITQAAKLKKVMVESCWIDREPYFRVHDWWEYTGRFLQIKWKNYPERWQAVRDAYRGNTPKNSPENGSEPQDLDQPTIIAQTNHALPASEQEAVNWASMENVPADFAKDVYNQCVGVNWKDGANRDITNWRSYIKQRHSKRQEFNPGKRGGDVGKSPGSATPSVWEIKQRIEAKQKRLQELKNLGHEDAFGVHYREQDKAEVKKLREEIKELERKLAS